MSDRPADAVYLGTCIDLLSEAARTGEILDLTAPKGAASDDAQLQVKDRCVDAQALRHVLNAKELPSDPHGLRIRGARFHDLVDLTHIKYDHPLHLIECVFDAGATWTGATVKELRLSRCRTPRLTLDGATINGALRLDDIEVDCSYLDCEIDETRALGGVNARAVSVGRFIDLCGAVLTNVGGLALNLERATIDGGLFADSLHVEGAVSAPGVRISGNLDLNAARLNSGGRVALDLEGAEIGGEFYAGHGFKSIGEVRAVQARIGGQLIFGHASLRSAGDDDRALTLDGAQLAGGVNAGPLFEVDGEIRGVGAGMHQLVLRGSELRNPTGRALNIDNADIPGGVFAEGVRVNGEVRAVDTNLSDLVLDEAVLLNGGAMALNLESATLKRFSFKPSRCDGDIQLSLAAIGDLTTERQPPQPLVAVGWKVADIHGPLRTDRKAVEEWLRTVPDAKTSVQPWHEVAAVYDRNGDPAGARRLRFSAANRLTRMSPWPSKLTRCIYGALVGHGYYPLLATVWLVAVVLAGWVLVANTREDIVATKTADAAAIQSATGSVPTRPISGEYPCEPHSGYSCLNSLTFTINSLVPVAGMSTVSGWTIRSDATLWLTLVLPILKLLAWAFTALLLAGVTGLLRKT